MVYARHSRIVNRPYCILGLAIIISQSLLLFTVIKFMGASYLIYIGIKSLLEKKSHSQDIQKKSPQVNATKMFFQGFLGNLLNPKAILFFLALFTLILKPDTALYAKIFYCVEAAMIHLIWFSFLSIVITHTVVKNSLNKVQHYIVKVMGGVLLGFGIRLLSVSAHAAR